jgi:hypothetical protein
LNILFIIRKYRYLRGNFFGNFRLHATFRIDLGIMIIGRYFLAFLILIIINIKHAHFSGIKCFVIICILRNIISAKRVSPFINRLPIFCEILHCGEHHLLLIAFQWVILFISLNVKVKLSCLDIVDIVLLSNACLVIILNLKGLGVIIITRVISEHVIICELFLFLVECYLLPQAQLALIILRVLRILILIIYSYLVSFHPINFCFLHLCTYQIFIVR